MKQKNLLPNKPSELILLALGDLKKVERSKEYEVNMSQWHSPNGTCKVCLAGSVMAKSLNIPKQSRYESNINGVFNMNTQNKLFALDDFRSGDIRFGLQIMRKKRFINLFLSHMEVVRYEVSSSQFKRDMKKMAKLFQSKGL